jgi:predicted nicotinamide N-methyase
MSNQSSTNIVKLLIVDSDELNISNIVRTINDNIRIYDIYATNNSNKAISYMISSSINDEEANFDFIVIGDIIGEMDRLALLIYIKSAAQIKNIKVIIMGRDKNCKNEIYLSNGANAVVEGAAELRQALNVQ